jgi:hypothetical protein
MKRGTRDGTRTDSQGPSEEIIGAARTVLNLLKLGLDENQMIGYLDITDLELALLLNFKNARLE